MHLYLASRLDAADHLLWGDLVRKRLGVPVQLALYPQLQPLLQPQRQCIGRIRLKDYSRGELLYQRGQLCQLHQRCWLAFQGSLGC